MGQTLFDKLWDLHHVTTLEDGSSLLYIDRIFLHERTGSIALQELAASGRPVRHRQQVFCTMDHIVDTFPGRGDDTLMPSGKDFILATRAEARRADIRLFDLDDPDQGIAHVVSPEQGIALPGSTVVCPDSHSCTLGGIGALAWGIGSSEAEHALATKTLRLSKPMNMRITVSGALREGVTAKDLALHVIARFGVNGGAGYAIEYAGSAIRALGIEARLTLCNLAVEFSAFTAVVGPDELTIDYVKGRPYAPKGEDWNAAVAHWRTLHSDEAAHFDRELHIDGGDVEPTVTWGTSPQHAAPITACVPQPASASSDQERNAIERALQYQGLKAGQRLNQIPIDAAFIGSCTNSRISDLRAAAALLRGRHIAPGIKAVVVPGSRQVKRAAEAEGLDRVFTAAGFEWRDSGCSMCFYAGGETFGREKRVISSTNRNFEGRQGPQTRTHLASPQTVAASAVTGFITDAASLPALADSAAALST